METIHWNNEFHVTSKMWLLLGPEDQRYIGDPDGAQLW